MAEITVGLAPFRGLDLCYEPNMMKEGFSPDFRNVDVESGGLKSCKGYEAIKNVQGCLKLFRHYKSDGSYLDLALKNGNIENFADGTVYSAGYFADGDTVSMVNYQMNSNYITVICNGKNTPVKFDGNGISALGGNPPVASLVALHNERLFMAGNPQNPDRVYYSEGFNPESWDVALESGYIDLPSWDGGRIKDIRSIFGDLVVFKDYGIYRIYGTYPGEFGVDKISSKVGCVGKDAIAFNGEICFFLNDKGLCVYNGMSAKPLDDKRVKAIFEQVDFSRISSARLFDYCGKLYMFLPMEQDCVIEYDYISGVVTRKTGFEVKDFFFRDDYVCIIDENGTPSRFHKGDSFGNKTIDAYWRSKTYDLSRKGAHKNVINICFWARGNGVMTVGIDADGEKVCKTVELSDREQYFDLPMGARGRRFFLEIACKDGSSFEMDSPCLYVDIEEE